ncbi:MAG TPA: AsmA family protein [Gammaproteobacteria bacterium]|nr:AsmA family protein [Gammaproteobacteria bacterium]
MKWVKLVLGSLAVFALLLLIAGMLVAAFFDPNDYKGVATDAFTARTGRSLAVDQDLKLSFFPWLAVETGGVTIGNAPGFGGDAADKPPFATIEHVAARVKLLPLLSKQFEVGTVEIDGLKLNLARDAKLRGNWQDLLDAAKSAPAEPAAASEPAAQGGRSFAVEGVKIKNGTLLWYENTSQLRYTVESLDVSTGGIGSGDPVALTASLQFRDEVAKLTATLSASATAAIDDKGGVTAKNVDLSIALHPAGNAKPRELSAKAESVVFDRDAQTLAVTGLATDTAGVRATWTVTGKSLVDSPVVEGNISVAGAPIATLLEQLQMSPPKGVQAKDLGLLTLQSKFAYRADTQEVRVSTLSAELLGMKASGDATLKGSELSGNVTIPEFAPGDAALSVLRANSPAGVDLGALGKLAVATKFDANVSTGRASLTGLKVTALGATVSGNVDVVPGQKGSQYRGSLSTSRFSPEAAAKAFAKLLPPTLTAKELGMLRLDGKFAFDSAADTVSIAPFEAEMFGLSASGEASGRAVSKAATWTGHATFAQFSPQDLMRRFGLPPPETSDPKALTRANVDAKFDVDTKQARLNDVTLALDDSKITGNFTLTGFDKPTYGFALAVDRVDADRYLPPKAKDAKKGQTTAGDIVLPENNTMQLDGTVRVGDLRLAGLQFQEVGTRIVLGQGNAQLENARAHLYGGDFAGNMSVRAAGDKPGLSLSGKATGLQLEPLIHALTGQPANFTGAGSFDLDLAGHGRTVMENVQSAGGKVAFQIASGAIRGFNIGQILCQAYNATQGAPGPPGGLPKQTDYQLIRGSATVTSGVAQSNDLLARTAFMDVTGHGSLGLAEQKLDYELEAKLTGRVPIQNCQTMQSLVGESVPFKIKGTVTDPSVTPDFSKFLQRKAKEKLQDKILKGILK